jgi:hypothetical protein
MAHSDNLDDVTRDLITDEVIVGRHQLTQGTTGHPATAVGKVRQAVSGVTESFRHACGGLGIVVSEVLMGAPDVARRAECPDDTHALVVKWWRDLLSLGELGEPFGDAFVWDHTASGDVRQTFGIKAGFQFFVRLGANDRVNLAVVHGNLISCRTA